MKPARMSLIYIAFIILVLDEIVIALHTAKSLQL